MSKLKFAISIVALMVLLVATVLYFNYKPNVKKEIIYLLDCSNTKNGKKERTKMFENIECDIFSDSKYINDSHLPIITIHLKYNGNNPIKIEWDDDFGYVLWKGKFVLTSKSDAGKYDTSNLINKTGNVYPPRKIIELKKGDEVTSILDFSKLPISLEKELFIHQGKISLMLYIRDADKNQPIKPISNDLVLTKLEE